MAGIGEKIKFFRERAGVSQHELGSKINSAIGHISKIETGKINPTKEIVKKIADYLKLNSNELSYMIGPLVNPASDEEIRIIKEKFAGQFQAKGYIGFLTDDRWRLLDMSEANCKMMKLDREVYYNNHEHVIFENMLNDDFSMRKYLSEKEFKDILYSSLVSFYHDMGYMFDDKYYKKCIEIINSNPISRKLWQEISEKKPKLMLFNYNEIRFNYFGLNFSLKQSRRPVDENNRFWITEYLPTSFLLKILQRVF